MIETYQTEVIKKRRNARWFWSIVFLFATFLYFFFQGYYPDVRLGLKRIFSEGGSVYGTGSMEDLIKSFGIINVKTIPNTAIITVGSGSYGQDEERMTSYGTYALTIDNTGYLSNSLEFSIDREKRYFIEEFHLLKEPRYKSLSGILDIYPLDIDTLLVETASGMYASGILIPKMTIIGTGELIPIGGTYFSSGKTLITWQDGKFVETTADRINFVETCPDIRWYSDIFWCPSVGSIYTEDARYMTGIVDMDARFLIKRQSIIDIDDRFRTIKELSGTGKYVAGYKVYALENTYYTSSGNTLMPLTRTGEPIITELDTISMAREAGTEVLIGGELSGKKYLLIRHKKDPLNRTRKIELPIGVDFSEADYIDARGNLIIHTPKAILFIYRAGSKIEWLAEGDILSISETHAYYRKDGTVWQVTFGE